MKTNSSLLGEAKFASGLGLPLFAPGQMLYHNDLTALADYTRQVTQLMLRSLFGCGVVCGLCVKASFDCGKLTVVVDPGVALDCDGNVICVPKATTIQITPDNPTSLGDLWVVLRGFQKCSAPRASACSADEDETAPACTREQYWYEVHVLGERPECVCGCGAEKKAKPGRGSKNTGVAAYEANRAGVRKDEDPCGCADPGLDCYQDHYLGRCACACTNCRDCKCEWILLARLVNPKDPAKLWEADYAARRFVRPVLMRDPRCKEMPPPTDTPQPKTKAAPPANVSSADRPKSLKNPPASKVR